MLECHHSGVRCYPLRTPHLLLLLQILVLDSERRLPRDVVMVDCEERRDLEVELAQGSGDGDGALRYPQVRRGIFLCFRLADCYFYPWSDGERDSA